MPRCFVEKNCLMPDKVTKGFEVLFVYFVFL